jgi:CheY-like chemotaxis protein
MDSGQQLKGHVLIVDDDPDFREPLAEILERKGFSSMAVGNGRDALDYLRTQAEKPQLILLNLTMPVMSGWDFLAERHVDPELAAVPVLLVSGVDDLSQQALSLGVAGYLAKPVEVRILLEVMQRIMREG